jgi:RNA polymerase sigma-70 factor (ECF subfamily)
MIITQQGRVLLVFVSPGYIGFGLIPVSTPIQSPNADAAAAGSTLQQAANPAKWFKEEVHPHDAQLKSYLRGSFPSIRDVDDVVQESYLRIWRAAAHEPVKSAKAFLFLVARRVALNFLRKERNSPVEAYGDEAMSGVLDDKPNAREAAIIQDRIDLLADALMSLPPRCREIVVLHKMKGLTQKEVADQLGVSERTVETHVRNGVARCLVYLRNHGLEESLRDEA